MSNILLKRKYNEKQIFNPKNNTKSQLKEQGPHFYIFIVILKAYQRG